MLPEARVEGLVPHLREFAPLKAISPSRFDETDMCMLQIVFPSAAARMLPAHPASSMGTVVHQFLENATGETAIEREHILAEFDVAIARAEEAFGLVWFQRDLVPFSRAIPDYYVRRARAVDHIAEIRRRAAFYGTGADLKVHVSYEQNVSSPDGLVRGRVDALVDTEQGIVIRDYKTGPLWSGHDGQVGELAPKYITQLSMYAAILREDGDLRDIQLELVTIDGKQVSVSYDMDVALGMLSLAKERLRAANAVIERYAGRPGAELLDELAAPSSASCGGCAYRPACRPFLRESARLDGLHDVVGTVMERRRLGNGTVALDVMIEAGVTAKVRQLADSLRRHPALGLVDVGDSVGVFSLRLREAGGTYVEALQTTIYKMGV